MSGGKGGQVTPARQVAFAVLRRTFGGGEFTDAAFRAEAETLGLSGRERAQAQRLSYGAVQRRGTTDAIAGQLARRRPGSLDPPVLAAMRLGLYELIFSDGTPDHAAVSQAVDLTRGGGAPQAAGLVNAVLRRAIRERERIDSRLTRDRTVAEAAVAHSAPEWLAELWWREQGPDLARSLMAAANRPAERALRINTSRWSVAEAIADAAERGAVLTEAAGGEPPGAPIAEPGRPGGEHPLGLGEMVVCESGWATIEPWIQHGLATPQSRGSAAAVAILDPQPGEMVLDVCAGPGTKTGQIAARMEGQGELIAVELDESRAEQTAGQLRRLGVHMASVVEMDAAEAGFDGPGFDRVLVDAPCSDLGALNSRPDARWRKSPRQIERVAELQSRILATAAAQVRPGGTLVYSTCTISMQENERQAQALAASAGEPGAEGAPTLRAEDLGAAWPELASPHDPRFLQIRSDRDRTTGFFLARFRRSPVNGG